MRTNRSRMAQFRYAQPFFSLSDCAYTKGRLSPGAATGRTDVKTLPPDLEKYKSTPEFDETSVPAGLLKAHQTKAGTWGRIVILSGKLNYRILEPELEEITLTEDVYGVVEPTVLHEVAPLGEVRFRVEFYRASGG